MIEAPAIPSFWIGENLGKNTRRVATDFVGSLKDARKFKDDVEFACALVQAMRLELVNQNRLSHEFNAQLLTEIVLKAKDLLNEKQDNLIKGKD